MTMIEIKAMQKRLALLEEENLILKNNIYLHKGIKEKSAVIKRLSERDNVKLL